jgi:hypothetical protein
LAAAFGVNGAAAPIVGLLVGLIGLGVLEVWDRKRSTAGEPPLPQVQRMPVDLKRVEPFRYPGDVLLRINVNNLGDRRATYSGQVTEIRGGSPSGPEFPYDVSWRGYDSVLPAGHRSLPPGGEDMINVASGIIINEAAARSRSPDQWSTALSMFVGSRSGEQAHPVPLERVRDVDDFLSREVLLTVLVLHEESQEYVARRLVRLWYFEDSGGLYPDLEVLP